MEIDNRAIVIQAIDEVLHNGPEHGLVIEEGKEFNLKQLVDWVIKFHKNVKAGLRDCYTGLQLELSLGGWDDWLCNVHNAVNTLFMGYELTAIIGRVRKTGSYRKFSVTF